ncbi:MAG: RodZ domain-containing protein [Caldimonas sp.]
MSDAAGQVPSAPDSPTAGTADAAAATGATAGRLLREARERQGLHIAALAASIKVTPKKLEMLEADRYDGLLDATFTRALAQTVCRALKIDPVPVLRLLPPPSGYRLEQLGEGLNTPFRERHGVLVQKDWTTFATRPALWITLLILAAAVAVFFLPPGLFRVATANGPPASTTTTTTLAPRINAPGPTNLTRPVDEAATVAPFIDAATAAAPSALASASVASASTAASEAGVMGATAPAGMLQVQTSAASWVEVRDSRDQPLVGRVLKAGESISIDGTPPLRVQIGNASATRVIFRGKPTDLAAFTRDNVARLELR